MITRLFNATLVLMLLALSGSANSASLQISNAWIKNLPPVVPLRAGYMTIENNTSNTLSIIGVESDGFTTIDIHETIEKGGMMSMHAIDTLTIPAGVTLQLAPAGIHLMMKQPQNKLKLGDTVSVTLQLDDSSTQVIQMTVKQ